MHFNQEAHVHVGPPWFMLHEYNIKTLNPDSSICLMMRPAHFSRMLDMWSDSSAHNVLRGWQCPEILHESLQPGFTTGVKLSAQIIPFFICRNSPEDMIYKYSSRRHEIQGRPGAANHVGLAFSVYGDLLVSKKGTHSKSEVTNYNVFQL